MHAADAFRVAWYRFGRTLRRRWTGYLTITLLLGLVGGLAMGSIAAARRTQGAYPAYLAATNPSDLTVLTGVSESASGYDPAVIKQIAALPDVRHVASYAGLNVAILGLNGQPVPAPFIAGPLPGSLDGEYFTTDRVTAVQGRLPDPSRPDEIAIDAKETPADVHVGTVAELGFYTNPQLLELYEGKHVTPAARQRVTVVGAVVYSAEEIQDDIDVQRDGGALFTPALTRKLIGCCASYTETVVQLRPGTKVADAEAALQRVLPAGFPIEFYDASLTVTKAQRAIAPTSIALAVFGGIAALAALIIAGQVIGRQLRRDLADLTTMRALGAGPAVTTADGLPGVLAAVVAGALLAAVVAVALSPLAPLGAIRAVYPTPGVAFDAAVLGGGIAAIIAVMSGTALVIARRRVRAPAASVRPYRPLGVRAVRAVQALGLPVSAAEGVRLAFGPGADRDRVTVAPAIFGTVLASVVMLATITFGSSLTRLVSQPALYGWNWTFDVSSGNTTASVHDAAPVLNSDPAVAAWTGIWYATATIEGQAVPVIGMTPNAPIAPPLLSGNGLRAPDEIVLGAATLAALHKQVGDWVTVTDNGSAPFKLRIAGTATLPSLGVAQTLHTEMGTGAVRDYQHIPDDTAEAPNEILVTLRPGADVAAQQQFLGKEIAPPRNGGVVSGVQRPAEITDYRSMGAAPLILSCALAAGAVASLWLTLAASVRRRRTDLALLKTLGLTRRQLAATVAWQSTVAVAVGALIGVPLGIALGRYLWNLFAREISVIPEPSVPVPVVLLVVAGALAAANLVAAFPGRAAARVPAATLLRAE